ncbi:interleukin-5 receptor subunit alpha [Astyanax mexicanus]|uniref:interleukin-5 receptor subunit alpha n=1 Tax=Astyanax mexicanus TaxID=7994 RepID=UPI0020CAAC42|nr:interleukin-5 receptor subunit alpha [Astyanax mexicanus]
MRLCGLLLILSLVRAETVVSSHGIDPICQKIVSCDEVGHYICEIIDRNGDCQEYEWENSTAPESFRELTEIYCIVYKSNQLNCSWSTDMIPEDAQYSAFYHSCHYNKNNTNHPLNCSSTSDGKRVECHGEIVHSEHVMVEVKVSISGHSFILCNTFMRVDIEILEPPTNITAFIESENLEIEWSPPTDGAARDCFDYELNINDDIVNIPEKSKYTKQNIDLTKTYSIKIRAQWNHCANNDRWSDWSEIKVVGPSKNLHTLNWYVIASIALVLPMILLAILLVFKFQRLTEKLFPSIPSPSVKVKMLLEKEDFGQVMPPKQCGGEAEEGTNILHVTSYKD